MCFKPALRLLFVSPMHFLTECLFGLFLTEVYALPLSLQPGLAFQSMRLNLGAPIWLSHQGSARFDFLKCLSSLLLGSNINKNRASSALPDPWTLQLCFGNRGISNGWWMLIFTYRCPPLPWRLHICSHFVTTLLAENVENCPSHCAVCMPLRLFQN